MDIHGYTLTKDTLSRTLQRVGEPAADQVVGRRPDNFFRVVHCARDGCGRDRDARSQHGRLTNSRKVSSTLTATDGYLPDACLGALEQIV